MSFHHVVDMVLLVREFFKILIYVVEVSMQVFRNIVQLAVDTAA